VAVCGGGGCLPPSAAAAGRLPTLPAAPPQTPPPQAAGSAFACARADPSGRVRLVERTPDGLEYQLQLPPPAAAAAGALLAAAVARLQAGSDGNSGGAAWPPRPRRVTDGGRAFVLSLEAQAAPPQQQGEQQPGVGAALALVVEEKGRARMALPLPSRRTAARLQLIFGAPEPAPAARPGGDGGAAAAAPTAATQQGSRQRKRDKAGSGGGSGGEGAGPSAAEAAQPAAPAASGMRADGGSGSVTDALERARALSAAAAQALQAQLAAGQRQDQGASPPAEPEPSPAKQQRRQQAQRGPMAAAAAAAATTAAGVASPEAAAPGPGSLLDRIAAASSVADLAALLAGPLPGGAAECEWQGAAAHLLRARAADAAAACARLEALGVAPTPEWAAAAAPAVLGQEGTAAAAALAQLLAWAAGAAGAAGAPLAAALGQALPLLDAPALRRVLAAVEALPAPRRTAVEAGMWRWLQSDAAAAAGLAPNQLAELLARLPQPRRGDEAAARPDGASARGADARPLLGSAAAGGIGAARSLNEATQLLALAAEKDPAAALAWLAKALQPFAAPPTDEADADAAEAAVLRLVALVRSLAELDLAGTLAAAAPVARALAACAGDLGPAAAAEAGKLVAWMAAGARRLASVVEDGDGTLPAGTGGSGNSSSEAPSAAEAWAAAAADAAAAWLRALPPWAAARGAGAAPEQLFAVLQPAAALADLAPGGAWSSPQPSAAAVGAEWLEALDVTLCSLAAPGAAPPGGGELLAAVAALPRALGRAPSAALLEAALAAAARDHLSANASALCAALCLLDAAAGGPGGAGLPARHAPLANSACAALASKAHGVSEFGLSARALARATRALASLAASGGAGGAVATTAALSRILGQDPGAAGGGGAAPAAAAAWRPPPPAARWVVASWAAAAQDAPGTVLLGFTAAEAADLLASLADCVALAGLLDAGSGAPAAPRARDELRRLQPLLAAAGARLTGAGAADVTAAAEAGGAAALSALARAAGGGGSGDAALAGLAAACAERVARRAAKWPAAAQALVNDALRISGSSNGGLKKGSSGSPEEGSSGTDAKHDSAPAAAAPAATDAAGPASSGATTSWAPAPSMAQDEAQALMERALAQPAGQQPLNADGADAPAAPVLLAALRALKGDDEGSDRGAALTRREAQRLLGEVEVAYWGGGGGAGWPADAALQHALVGGEGGGSEARGAGHSCKGRACWRSPAPARLHTPRTMLPLGPQPCAPHAGLLRAARRAVAPHAGRGHGGGRGGAAGRAGAGAGTAAAAGPAQAPLARGGRR
jgi:hypothetical protein